MVRYELRIPLRMPVKKAVGMVYDHVPPKNDPTRSSPPRRSLNRQSAVFLHWVRTENRWP